VSPHTERRLRGTVRGLAKLFSCGRAHSIGPLAGARAAKSAGSGANETTTLGGGIPDRAARHTSAIVGGVRRRIRCGSASPMGSPATRSITEPGATTAEPGRAAGARHIAYDSVWPAMRGRPFPPSVAGIFLPQDPARRHTPARGNSEGEGKNSRPDVRAARMMAAVFGRPAVFRPGAMPGPGCGVRTSLRSATNPTRLPACEAHAPHSRERPLIQARIRATVPNAV
jgi:hypothetical protein